MKMTAATPVTLAIGNLMKVTFEIITFRILSCQGKRLGTLWWWRLGRFIPVDATGW
jgi:hypothetical protein